MHVPTAQPNEESRSSDTGSAEPPHSLIEFGWIVLARDEDVAEIVHRAQDEVRGILRRIFPDYQWQMPMIHHARETSVLREEPVVLLRQGSEERESWHWDFALVITDVDLRSYVRPFALATPSRALSVAVLSIERLRSPSEQARADPDEKRKMLERRIVALALHLFGDLNGLHHCEDSDSFMQMPDQVSDLDRPSRFTESERKRLEVELADIADARLEERAERPSRLRFYLRAAWIGRDDIASAIRQAQPWRFPVRLSRLSIAAVSTVLILLLTAEAWDLALRQRPWEVVTLSLLGLAGTSVFILRRQNLLVGRGPRRMTEQRVFTNVAMTAVVMGGMVTTYLLLFVLVLLLSLLLFDTTVIANWAESMGKSTHFGHHCLLAGFLAALGILIGALGASFEGPHYFQHMALVDEET